VSLLRGRRQRIGVGIYRYAIGISATVKADARQREKRLKATAKPEDITAWQGRMRATIKLGQDARAPRGLPWPVVTAILAQLATRTGYDKIIKARVHVMATTGWPHAVIARLECRDLQLTGPRLHVLIRPRQNGAGVPARAIAITEAAVTALKAFAAAKAFGEFSHLSLYTTFTLAAKMIGAPQDARLYDLGHTMAVRLYTATRDLRAVKELMLHASLATPAQYAEQAVSDGPGRDRRRRWHGG
jgi:site-specific recombinase XerC